MLQQQDQKPQQGQQPLLPPLKLSCSYEGFTTTQTLHINTHNNITSNLHFSRPHFKCTIDKTTPINTTILKLSVLPTKTKIAHFWLIEESIRELFRVGSDGGIKVLKDLGNLHGQSFLFTGMFLDGGLTILLCWMYICVLVMIYMLVKIIFKFKKNRINEIKKRYIKKNYARRIKKYPET